MIETYTHKCIKCSEVYTDNDTDAYYCGDCVIEKNRIAKEVDKRQSTIISSRIQKSELKVFDEIARSRGSRGFVNIKDLGITLN